ncbi:acyltransferase [Pelomonas sp. SE-A7]|uniref:acyltransferase n=1 Tax=Pelomonas sp. SE-A7 TaxID=3054953 RepID=UPI00259CA8A4|nr:acyltransferase [Pelomonas sp. SE-A7]MDM4767314.1 acyltransferase [Pelomonas sp. SE-A7]
MPLSRFVPAPLLGLISGLLLGLNTLVTFTLMIVPALLKLVLPFTRKPCDRLLNALASSWVARNSVWLSLLERSPWQVEGAEGLNRHGWYLVSPNHRSWVDILVLQRVFHGRIPFLKFFLKQELIWVPVIGLAWWALDFPFMKRGRSSGAQAADLETTRKACQKFRSIPTTVINFVEGTRFTQAKHARQQSPYRHLLKPKVGALGIALATMGEQFEALLDVTLVYPDGTPSFWDLLSGRLGRVEVVVQRRSIPAEVVGGDPGRDKTQRARIGTWIEGQWAEKDALIEQRLLPRD